MLLLHLLLLLLQLLLLLLHLYLHLHPAICLPLYLSPPSPLHPVTCSSRTRDNLSFNEATSCSREPTIKVNHCQSATTFVYQLLSQLVSQSVSQSVSQFIISQTSGQSRSVSQSVIQSAIVSQLTSGRSRSLIETVQSTIKPINSANHHTSS